MDSPTLAALAAMFAAAVLIMILLALLIWAQWAEQNRLRAHLATAQQQAAALSAQLQQAQQEREGLQITSPLEWHTCLSCRSPLEVVLCPHCHAPYHQSWTSPRGVTLNCWEAVVQSGRCWNCKQDLTAFRKADTIPARAPALSPLALSLALLGDGPGVRPSLQALARGAAQPLRGAPSRPPLPAMLPPQRLEAPPPLPQPVGATGTENGRTAGHS